MNAPGVRHFFVLEAGEYVERLDSLLDSAGSDAPDTHALLRVARALRGASTMARLDSLSELAGAVEALVRATADGTLPWNQELRATLRDTASELRALIGRARNWSEEDDARAREKAASLAAVLPSGAVSPGRPAGVPFAQRDGTPAEALAASGGTLHLVSGAAELSASLTALLSRPADESLLDDARRRVAALRGVAAVADHRELGVLLDALDSGLRALTLPLASPPHATLSNVARMLRAASDDIRAGRSIASDEEWTAVVNRLTTMADASEEPVVPIARLFHEDEGPHLVQAAEQPPTTPLSRFRMESAGQAENLRRLIASVREGTEGGDTAVSRIEAALVSLRDVAMSYGETELARLIAAGAEAAARADRLTLDAIDAMAARLLAEASSVEELCDRLTDLARGHRLAAMIGHGFGDVGGRLTPRSLTPGSLSAIMSGEARSTVHETEPVDIRTLAPTPPGTPAVAAHSPAASHTAAAPGHAHVPVRETPATTRDAPTFPPRPGTYTPREPAAGIPAAPGAPQAGTPQASRRTVTPTGAELHAFLADGLAGLERMEREPLGEPAEVEDQVVPIESLLYDRQGALQRARELRSSLLQNGTPASRETLEEIFDLLEIAAQE